MVLHLMVEIYVFSGCFLHLLGYLKSNRKSSLKVMMAFTAYVIESRYGKSCFRNTLSLYSHGRKIFCLPILSIISVKWELVIEYCSSMSEK